MKIVTRLMPALTLLLLPLISSAVIYVPPPANLLSNGNFEAGTSGWTIGGNGGHWFDFNGGADGGAFYGLDSLNLSPLYQEVSTTPGQAYNLTFYIRGSYPAQQAPPFAVSVSWNSQQVGTFTLNTFSSDWVLETLTLVGGPGSQSQLLFNNPDGTLSSLDDVSLVAVPEPSLLALALPAIAIVFWRRVRNVSL